MAAQYIDASSDFGFKLLFSKEGNLDLLKDFLTSVFDEHLNVSTSGLQLLPTILQAENNSSKQGVVDILCQLQNGRKVVLEMQNSYAKGFKQRIQYYAAKVYSQSLLSGKGDDAVYSNLRQVIVVALCNYMILGQKNSCISHHLTTDKVTRTVDLDGLSYFIIQLPYLNITLEQLNSCATKLDRWMYIIKHSGSITNEAVPILVAKQDKYLLKAFDVLKIDNLTTQELENYSLTRKRQINDLAYMQYQYSVKQARTALTLHQEDGIPLERVKIILQLDDEEEFLLQELLQTGTLP